MEAPILCPLSLRLGGDCEEEVEVFGTGGRAGGRAGALVGPILALVDLMVECPAMAAIISSRSRSSEISRQLARFSSCGL